MSLSPKAKVMQREIDELQAEGRVYHESARTYGLLAIAFYVTGMVMLFTDEQLVGFVAIIGGVGLGLASNRYMHKHRKVYYEIERLGQEIFEDSVNNLMITLKESAHEETRRDIARKARTININRNRRASGIRTDRPDIEQ